MINEKDGSTLLAAKLRKKTLTLFLILAIILFTTEIVVLYSVMIPKILDSVKLSLNESQLDLISDSFDKIVMGLSVWAFCLFFITGLLIYILGNIKK